ncbi:MAG: diphthine--ammonia ligase [Anaerolineales bacterium]|nr:diphthine--ammonia ligase [Anaerolineales bacterium]
MIPSTPSRKFFCSWSGGKDSALALFHAIRGGGRPLRLLTMMSEDGHGSRSHGLAREVLEEQARRIGIPIVFRSASWAAYESVFSSALEDFRAEGMAAGVFGDIDLEEHRAWCARVCAAKGLAACHPLWKRPRRELLEDFIGLGFAATIIAARADCLGPEWLGRRIDAQAVAELEKLGIDPSGEAGEYHTVVTGGPIFHSRIRLAAGDPVRHGDHWFLPVTAVPSAIPE